MIDIPLRDVMTQGYLYVEEEQSTGKALSIMRDMRISCVYVMRDTVPTGMISERAILAQSLVEKDLFSLAAASVMSRPLLSLTPEHTVFEACDFMQNHAIRHLGIVDRHGDLKGTITPGNIVDVLESKYFSSSLPVKAVMDDCPVFLQHDSSMYDSARSIVEARCCCGVIMDGNYAVGVITEKDIALCIGYGEDIRTTPLERSMSKRVIGVDENDSVADAIRTMKRHHIHRVMVFNEHVKITGYLALSTLIYNMNTIIGRNSSE